MFAQVGGLYRRQNSGHPLFSVRPRSRAKFSSPRQIPADDFCRPQEFFCTRFIQAVFYIDTIYFNVIINENFALCEF